jgi:hypothetical protein
LFGADELSDCSTVSNAYFRTYSSAHFGAHRRADCSTHECADHSAIIRTYKRTHRSAIGNADHCAIGNADDHR